MKKKIAGLAVWLITACFLCACGKADKAAYAGVYSQLISELDSTSQADRFALVDVNKDRIPELAAVSSEGSWEKDQVFLYTTDGKEAILLVSDIAPGMEGHSIGFVEKKNIIIKSGAVSGEAYELYRIEDNKAVKYMTFENRQLFDDEGDEIFEMYIDDAKVSDEEYEKKMNSELLKKGKPTVLAETDYEGMVEEKWFLVDGLLYTEEAGQKEYLSCEDMMKELNGK